MAEYFLCSKTQTSIILNEALLRSDFYLLFLSTLSLPHYPFGFVLIINLLIMFFSLRFPHHNQGKFIHLLSLTQNQTPSGIFSCSSCVRIHYFLSYMLWVFSSILCLPSALECRQTEGWLYVFLLFPNLFQQWLP